MKKFLFLLTVVLLSMTMNSLKAQNANRNGFFIEGGIGAVMGDRPVTNLSELDDIYEEADGFKFDGGDSFNIVDYRKAKKTYGLGANIAFGYRLAFSSHMAFDLKVKAKDATYRFNQTLLAELGIGLRYISTDFGGNKSMYVNIGSGFGMFLDNQKIAVPYEVGVGINLSNHFYTGLNWDAQYSLADKWIFGKHYGSLGIQFGFRL